MSVAYNKGLRDDITDLRALAVIPVLLFHAKIPYIPAGLMMHKTYGLQQHFPEYAYDGDPQ